MSSSTTLGSVGLALGSPAVDFHLKAVDAKSYSLKDFGDRKALVIVFSCNHCPYVQAYEDRMVRLQRDYSGKGVTLVAINSNDDHDYPDHECPRRDPGRTETRGPRDSALRLFHQVETLDLGGRFHRPSILEL
ncbi:redoxin domain-containing protein [Candidatus Bathyarchaeota archaeon]|nr:MAG: redoxin domain-containing protein [Candidatus Bathyarchaeota archaeon]